MPNVNAPSKNERLIRLNHDLRQLVDEKILGGFEEKGEKAFFCAFAITKGSKTHEAIICLCKNYLGEDAFILGRSLAELTVITSHILKDKTSDRLERYMEYASVLQKQAYKYLMSRDDTSQNLDRTTGSSEKTRELIQKIDTEYKRVQEKHQYDYVGWSKMKLSEMFKEMGRPEAYDNVYRPMCAITHSNVKSASEYIKAENDSYVAIVGPSPNHITLSLISAFDFYFILVQTMNEHLRWGLDEHLSEFSNEFLQIMKAD